MSRHARRRGVQGALLLPLVWSFALPSRHADAGKKAQPLGMEARVACHADLDALARRLRAQAAGLSQAPKDAASAAASERRAEDTVRLSHALEKIWGRAITADQLQAELNRMARSSQDPERLREIFATLGDDPGLVAECVARPALVRRLARNWYAGEAPFEHWWAGIRDRFAAEENPPLDEASQVFTLPTVSDDGCAFDTWSPTANDRPDPRDHPTAVWTGAEMIVWGGELGGGVLMNSGGRYDPATDTWAPIALSGAPTARYLHTAVWTGTRMIIWGGYGSAGPVQSGSSYDPATDSWTATGVSTQTPSARGEHVAVWTGSEMLIWGGHQAGAMAGSRYDPTTDTWTWLPEASLLAPRYSATAVWTGTEMIVWGGGSFPALFNDGARFNPALNQWTYLPESNAPTGRTEHTAVWTGASMIIWGGNGGGPGGPGTFLATGALFTPGTGAWTPVHTFNAPSGRFGHTAAWTGSRMVVWGGLVSAGVRTSSGARYDPVGNAWTATSGASAPQARMRHGAVWTGTEMFVWGGDDYGTDGFIYLQSGGRYDPVGNSWVPLAANASVPEARRYHSTVWTGVEMIVWGGLGSSLLRSGGRYEPATDNWSPTSLGQAPSQRRFHTAVWTGSEMIVWGGEVFGFVAQDGGRYDPDLDAWTATSLIAAPAPRAHHSAVWTGREMVVAGGADDVGRYDPLTDTWVTSVPPDEIVSSRTSHVALWTGGEMLVWGGAAADLDAFGNSVSLDTSNGGRFDPSHDSWERLYDTGAPPPTRDATAVWTGSEMLVWGGTTTTGQAGSAGGRYDPLADAWAPLSTGPDAPSARRFHSAVWTGAEMLVWGGQGAPGQILADGARYDPLADAWSPMSGVGAPRQRSRHGAVYTGRPVERMIVWGGLPNASSGGGYCAPCSEAVWYADTDGDGRGDGGVALSACAQPVGYAASGDDCDDADAERSPGLPEACSDGKDNDCNGTVDDALPPGPVLDLFVELEGGAMILEWSHAAAADAFDLTRGSLTALRAAGGDFAAAGSACIANDAATRAAADAGSPQAGEIWFYLPRGVSCAGRGTYDGAEPAQVGTRAALDGAPNACP